MANRVVSVALKAEIGQYVSSMTRAAASTTALGSASDDMARKTKGNFDAVGKVGQYAGLAVAGALVGIIAKSTEFEAAMSGVAAATGLAGDSLQQLRETAMQAGADTQYSATEAAAAITEMSKAGVSAADIMGGGLDGALALAAAGQLAVADAAEIASVAMTQFGLAGSDLPHVADLLAAGAGKAMGSVDDLGQALNQAGLIASAAGLSIEETTGGLAAFASAGLVGSDAGTSMKTMLQALQAPSGKAAELMASLGINMYDANGNMLGLSDMAGVLQSQLSGLTEEQRNSALATIFGSDAVRAANVLYREGSTGIQGWINKVDDQGYAAQQAAALTDNLRGDLERLGGAFDTLLISLGSGSQGPLRALTQGLTTVVDGLGGLLSIISAVPTPVLLAVAAFAGLTALRGPMGAFTDRAAAGITGLSTSMGMAVVNGNGLKGALSNAIGSINPVTAAIGAGAIAFGIYAQETAEVEAQLKAARDAGADFSTALSDNGGVVDSLIVTAARAAVETAGLAEAMRDAGVDARTYTAALAGNRDAQDQAREAAERADAQAAAMQSPNMLASGMSVLTGEVSKNADAWKELEDAQNTFEAEGAGGALMGLLDGIAGGSGEAAIAIGALTTGTVDYSEQVSEANKEIEGLIASLAILTGSNNSLLVAENAVGEAIASATGALDNQTGSVLNADGSINSMSEAGRAASDVLLDMTNSSNELIATMIQQGYSTAEVAARDAALRASFIQTANQMGITGADAERLADSIYGIPAERQTRIEADTSQAEAAVQAFVARVTGTRVVLTGDFVGGAGVNVRRAQGGPVWGAGTATSDSIPAMLSNGEYVVKASAVSKYGVAALDAVNSGRLDDIAHFADGGLASTYSVPVALAGLEQISVSLAQMAEVAASAPVAAGPAGGGSIGGGWQSIFNVVKGAIPAARQNSTYRPGDPGYHGRGKAVDFGFGSGPGGAGSAGLASINRFLYDNYGSKLAELIYDGVGDDRPDIKNGRPHTYNAATRAQHANHVHAANYRDGGMVMPQYKQGTPFVPNDGPAYLHKGEAVIPKFANGGMVKLGDVSDAVWDGLLSAGWKGRQGDSMEALYAPASREFSGASSSAASGPSASQAFPDGMRISGTVQFDPSRGMIQFVDARVFNGASEMTRIATGRGF